MMLENLFKISFEEPTPENPEVIKKDVDSILADVSIPVQQKQEISNAIVPLIQRRESDYEISKLVKQILKDIDWKWSFFDEWKAKFEQRGVFPANWEKMGLIDPVSPKPNSVEDAFGFFGVQDLRKWLTDIGKCPKPFPKKREDLFDWVVKNISWQEIGKVTEPFYQKYLEKQAYWEKQKRVEVLVRYISAIRMTQVAVEAFKRMGCKAEPLPATGDIWAQEMAEKFKKGEIKSLPPYYPSDFTAVVPVQDKLLTKPH